MPVTKVSLRSRFRLSILAAVLLCLLSLPLLSMASNQGDLRSQQWAYGMILLAFMLMTWVDRVRIDPHKARITRERGFLFPMFRDAYALGAYRNVELQKKTKRRNDGEQGSDFYPIVLVGKVNVRIAKLGDAVFARRVGEKIARAMGVPLHNRLLWKRNVRSPDMLDTPLAAQWAKKAKMFSRPTLPPDTKLTLTESGDLLKITFAPDRYALRFVLGLAVFATIFLGVVIQVTDTPIPVYLFGALFFGTLAYAALAMIGNYCLIVGPGYVSFRTGSVPLSRKINLQDIEEMIVSGGINLLGDKAMITIALPRKKEDAHYLEQLIQYEIMARSRIKGQ